MSTESSISAPTRLSQNVPLPHWEPKVEFESCIACGKLGASAFLNPANRPLATVWWPETQAEAERMQLLPHEFLRCLHCGHVFNRAFSYAEIPYRRKPNRMFNRGHHWKEHVHHVMERAQESLPKSPTVVEVGCGDGSFLVAVHGFDP